MEINLFLSLLLFDDSVSEDEGAAAGGIGKWDDKKRSQERDFGSAWDLESKPDVFQ